MTEEERTRPQNLLVVASHDWPIPPLGYIMALRWHSQLNRPHFVLHVVGPLGDVPVDHPEFVANSTVYELAEAIAHAGGAVVQHDATEHVGLGERRAVEATLEEMLLRPKPGQEIDHVIALIFNHDRTPSVAVMHGNMTNTPNTIIRINDNGRI